VIEGVGINAEDWTNPLFFGSHRGCPRHDGGRRGLIALLFKDIFAVSDEIKGKYPHVGSVLATTYCLTSPLLALVKPPGKNAWGVGEAAMPSMGICGGSGFCPGCAPGTTSAERPYNCGQRWRGTVDIADKAVRIMGSKGDLLRTLVAASGVKPAMPGVRGSVLKWWGKKTERISSAQRWRAKSTVESGLRRQNPMKTAILCDPGQVAQKSPSKAHLKAIVP
jgi:hypothetical protein